MSSCSFSSSLGWVFFCGRRSEEKEKPPSIALSLSVAHESREIFTTRFLTIQKVLSRNRFRTSLRPGHSRRRHRFQTLTHTRARVKNGTRKNVFFSYSLLFCHSLTHARLSRPCDRLTPDSSAEPVVEKDSPEDFARPPEYA